MARCPTIRYLRNLICTRSPAMTPSVKRAIYAHAPLAAANGITKATGRLGRLMALSRHISRPEPRSELDLTAQPRIVVSCFMERICQYAAVTFSMKWSRLSCPNVGLFSFVRLPCFFLSFTLFLSFLYQNLFSLLIQFIIPSILRTGLFIHSSFHCVHNLLCGAQHRK
jgi:hypothetical protein